MTICEGTDSTSTEINQIDRKTRYFTSRKPHKSQIRSLKIVSSIIKTITVATRKNQQKTISHIRRFLVSQIRHLKTRSLIPCSPEQISQSRRLYHFPYSSPRVSRFRRFVFPVFYLEYLLFIFSNCFFNCGRSFLTVSHVSCRSTPKYS